MSWGLSGIKHIEEMDAGTASELRDLAGRADAAESAARSARDDAVQLARQLQQVRLTAAAATSALVSLLSVHVPRGTESRPSCSRCGESWPCGVWALAAPGVDRRTREAIIAERQQQRQQRGLRPLDVGGES
jgi:hypothetical protein